MAEYINGIAGAPHAAGPYSQAVISGNLIFLSGQVGLNPETGKLVEGGIESQTKQVLANVSAVLKHFNLVPGDIVKSLIFLTDLSNFQTVNGIYAEWLGAVRPARSTVQVAGLPLGAQVEVEVIAELRK